MSDMVRVPDSKCPRCGKVWTAATLITGGETVKYPRPGDWSICGNCETALVLGDDLQLRNPTAAEFESLTEAELADLVRATNLLREDKARGSKKYPMGP